MVLSYFSKSPPKIGDKKRRRKEIPQPSISGKISIYATNFLKLKSALIYLVCTFEADEVSVTIGLWNET